MCHQYLFEEHQGLLRENIHEGDKELRLHYHYPHKELVLKVWAYILAESLWWRSYVLGTKSLASTCKIMSSAFFFTNFPILVFEGRRRCHDKNYFSIISNSSLRVYPVSFGPSTGGTIVAKELGKVWVFSSPEALAVLKEGMGGIRPGFAVLVANRDPAHEKKIIEKKKFLF